MAVFRGHTQFYVRVEMELIEGTDFGRQLLKQIKLWKDSRISISAHPTDLIDELYKYFHSMLEELAPQTLLEDLSLGSFLHAPTFHLELIVTGIDSNIYIKGKGTPLYTPCFTLSPMHITDLPEACDNIPRFLADDINIVYTENGKKSLDTVQGKL